MPSRDHYLQMTLEEKSTARKLRLEIGDKFFNGMRIPHDFLSCLYMKACLSGLSYCPFGFYSIRQDRNLSETRVCLVTVDEGWLIRFANLAND